MIFSDCYPSNPLLSNQLWNGVLQEWCTSVKHDQGPQKAFLQFIIRVLLWVIPKIQQLLIVNSISSYQDFAPLIEIFLFQTATPPSIAATATKCGYTTIHYHHNIEIL